MNTSLNILARDLRISGAVQGVGFRPFVYRTALSFGVGGWVRNDSRGVAIRAVGSEDLLERFQRELLERAPAPARIREMQMLGEELTSESPGAFRILDSEQTHDISAAITPDLATCPECMRELFDVKDRRYRYPFINCTHCGPRYTILERIPYDRASTTMKQFTMCAACATEYGDPDNRRYHAQPNACPECGPQLTMWSAKGREMATRHDALVLAADGIREGRIVAVKGLGGFHLMVDARNADALLELRRRKQREAKPFALMFPWISLVREACEVSDLEARTLLEPEAPIMLLRRRKKSKCGLADWVAPGSPFLGVMLPYTPLHHLLMQELGIPVVATSGNRMDEPICIDEQEALSRLAGIADLFLVHDRPIARPVDDSIVRVAAGRLTVMRRARGYAPEPVFLDHIVKEPVLAVGAHQKNTVALALGTEAFVSQHIGDLDTEPAVRAFENAVQTLEGLYQSTPVRYVCDMHPDYASTRYAHGTHPRPLPGGEEGDRIPSLEGMSGDSQAGAGLSPRIMRVQHHHAHIASCMVDNRLDGRVLGVAWDGTGYGPDGTVWGGEFLCADRGRYERIGHLRTFGLPGGDKTAREPRRAALGVLYEIFGEEAFSLRDLSPLQAFKSDDMRILQRMLTQGLQTPRTSSMGRLFDAVASLIGMCQVMSYEGQAGMELEYAAWRAPADISAYPIPFDGRADWEPMIRRIMDDVRNNRNPSEMARAFHETLAQLIVDVAHTAGERRIALSGGCFQNALLLERSVALLAEAGFEPYWHHHVPPNDGGISLGQLAIALNLKPET